MDEMIGKYRVLQLLGRGGMAEAYKVQLSGPAGFKRQHCIKRIRSEYADHPEFIKAFESEARIISRLLHPNIVQVFELIQYNGLCLVMEYIDGMDLDDILKMSKKLGLQVPADFAIYILESLLLALHHAHNLKVREEIVPVIHRDISPHNILLSTGGVAKLADFGIAKATGMSEATRTGVLKGKLAYMSPEQTKGGKSPIGPQSDLFAAGVVFWEMLANDRLFKATMEHQVLVNVMNFEPEPIAHLSPKVNGFLERILAPNVEERFQSAEEALEALKRIGVRPCTQADTGQMVTALKHRIELAKKIEGTKVSPKASVPNTLVGDPLAEPTYGDKTELSSQSNWLSTQMENTVGPQTGRFGRSLMVPLISGICGFLIAILVTFLFVGKEDIRPAAPKNGISEPMPVESAQMLSKPSATVSMPQKNVEPVLEKRAEKSVEETDSDTGEAADIASIGKYNPEILSPNKVEENTGLAGRINSEPSEKRRKKNVRSLKKNKKAKDSAYQTKTDKEKPRSDLVIFGAK